MASYPQISDPVEADGLPEAPEIIRIAVVPSLQPADRRPGVLTRDPCGRICRQETGSPDPQQGPSLRACPPTN